jgi:NhaP-type Na+/H+ or K+/H+ antiporter
MTATSSLTTALNATTATAAARSESNEQFVALAILLLISMIAVVFISAYIVRELRVGFVHESSVAIVIGLLVGLVVSLIYEPLEIKSEVVFAQQTFFLYLLPGIVFAASYNLERRSFFENLGSLIALDFFFLYFCFFEKRKKIVMLLRELLSTVWYLLALYMGSILRFFPSFLLSTVLFLVPFSLQPIPLQCWQSSRFLRLSFLFVCFFFFGEKNTYFKHPLFKELRVEPNLYANVFGESIFNDAVAIVLYRTFVVYLTNPITVESVFLGFGRFLLVLCGSVGIGVVIGGFSALFFKFTKFYRHVVLEGCLVFVFAYSSFLLAEGLALSGIISILSCGIMMGQYTVGNLSEKARLYTKEMFEVISTICETLIFVFIGLAVFTFPQQWDVALIFITIFACLVARAMQLLPLTAMINLFRYRRRRTSSLSEDEAMKMFPSIGAKDQVVLWTAGLRGAIAFALSLDVPSSNGGLILSTTLIVCIFTIFVLGSLTSPILKLLGVPVGVSRDKVSFFFFSFF